MDKITIIYIVISAISAILIAAFLYGFKKGNKPYFLAFLRALGLFLIALLLINPSFNKKSYTTRKPVLNIFVDNTKSIKYLAKASQVKQAVAAFKTDEILNDNYTVNYYSFGKQIAVLDSLHFDKSQTDISTVIDFINKTKQKTTKTILISDGNQTIGERYENRKTSSPIIPLLIGDTIQYQDVYVDQLNVNKFSYIKNKFPIEAFVNYIGNQSQTNTVSLVHKGRVIASKKVYFDQENSSKRLSFLVKGMHKGMQYYSLTVSKLDNEKNTYNNTKKFTVDIIDNKRNILIVSAIKHPDIAMLKRSIQSNEQLAISIKKPSDKIDWHKYQLVILYQVDSSFNSVFEKLNQLKKNYLLITGLHTNWNFLNRKQPYFTKRNSRLKEAVFPLVHNGFDAFQFKNIDFSTFSPLETQYGKLKISTNTRTILDAKINGIATDYPILSIVSDKQLKRAILDGEGIWKWRMEHFKTKKSFTNFDIFIVNLVQYLSSNSTIDRLAINYEKKYFQNDLITIEANFVDENYEFDATKTLELTLTNLETKKTKKYQFLVKGNQYQVFVDGLQAGNYSFTVKVLGTNFKKHGRLSVLDYDIEKQFATANYQKLQQFVSINKSKLYLDTANLITDLNTDTPKPIQLETITKTALVDWKWLLSIILLLFAIEWFVRKYKGMI